MQSNSKIQQKLADELKLKNDLEESKTLLKTLMSSYGFSINQIMGMTLSQDKQVLINLLVMLKNNDKTSIDEIADIKFYNLMIQSEKWGFIREETLKKINLEEEKMFSVQDVAKIFKTMKLKKVLENSEILLQPNLELKNDLEESKKLLIQLENIECCTEGLIDSILVQALLKNDQVLINLLVMILRHDGEISINEITGIGYYQSAISQPQWHQNREETLKPIEKKIVSIRENALKLLKGLQADHKKSLNQQKIQRALIRVLKGLQEDHKKVLAQHKILQEFCLMRLHDAQQYGPKEEVPGALKDYFEEISQDDDYIKKFSQDGSLVFKNVMAKIISNIENESEDLEACIRNGTTCDDILPVKTAFISILLAYIEKYPQDDRLVISIMKKIIIDIDKGSEDLEACIKNRTNCEIVSVRPAFKKLLKNDVENQLVIKEIISNIDKGSETLEACIEKGTSLKEYQKQKSTKSSFATIIPNQSQSSQGKFL